MVLVLLISTSPSLCSASSSTFPAFAPESKSEMVQAVVSCLQLSPEGDCSSGPHGPITEWDVSRVEDMRGMFQSWCRSFNADLSKWAVSSVTDMSYMFASATSFNGDIFRWDVSSVSKMVGMFALASSFNGDISKWTVSSVTDMSRMFAGATVFNGDISKWDVSGVTTMEDMFEAATSFNGDISNWDVSSVIDMNGMFSRATLFNGDISKWDVSNVVNMDDMFCEAKSFKQNLCGAAWVRSKATKFAMFTDSFGSISLTECTSDRVTQQYLSRLPITKRERELIARTTAGMMTCPKCGTFKKSGRVSCCAPGGAWVKNCGGAGNINVDHRWLEGVETCKRATVMTMHSSACPECGTIEKSGKTSCCGRGGSWFRKCGSAGNANIQHTWYEGIQACKARSKSVIGQHLNSAQQKWTTFLNDTHVTNSEAVIKVTKTVSSVSSSIITTSARMSITSTLIYSFIMTY